MRLNYSEDEDFPGQFNIWQANCRRSLGGKRGQSALKELEAALLALPEPRLVYGALCHEGDVCAVGAIALRRRIANGQSRDAALDALEHGAGTDDYADCYGEEVLGLPRLVAWKMVEVNDIDTECYYKTCEGPAPLTGDKWRDTHGYRAGVWTRFNYTPEERYQRVMAFVREHLQPVQKVTP